MSVARFSRHWCCTKLSWSCWRHYAWASVSCRFCSSDSRGYCSSDVKVTLKLLRIENAGILEEEKIVLQAITDTKLGNYIVLQSKKSPDGKVFSGVVPSAFWFTTMDVKQGDFIVLYTKVGVRSQKQGSENEPSSYFFYWDLEQPIWASDFKPTSVLASTWEWM